MKIKAAVLREAGRSRPYCDSKPLQIAEVDLDPPNRGEVLVQIKAVGLCHSDLVAITGERGKPMPIVIGHEAAGIVVELGGGVTGFELGDHVVPTYVASCGHCEMCAVGRPALCEPATVTNANAVLRDGTTRLHKDGQRIHHHSGVAGFAEYAVLPKDALIKIDKSIPFEHAALFGCGVVTGVGSLLNTAGVKPGEHVAVVGLGGVGLSALLAAVAAGAGRIIALDLNPEKLQLARELGADFAINAADSDCTVATGYSYNNWRNAEPNDHSSNTTGEEDCSAKCLNILPSIGIGVLFLQPGPACNITGNPSSSAIST